jgi:hypothetical protein
MQSKVTDDLSQDQRNEALVLASCTEYTKLLIIWIQIGITTHNPYTEFVSSKPPQALSPQDTSNLTFAPVPCRLTTASSSTSKLSCPAVTIISPIISPKANSIPMSKSVPFSLGFLYIYRRVIIDRHIATPLTKAGIPGEYEARDQTTWYSDQLE